MTLADRIRDGDPTALDELDALVEGCPSLPWRFAAPRPTCSGGIWSGPAGGANILVTPNADEQDLALIVALRNAYPALVARVRALEKTAEGLAIGEGLADEERDAWKARAEHAEAEVARFAAIAMDVKVRCETASVDEPVWVLPNVVIAMLEPLLAAHAAAVAERET